MRRFWGFALKSQPLKFGVAMLVALPRVRETISCLRGQGMLEVAFFPSLGWPVNGFAIQRL